MRATGVERPLLMTEPAIGVELDAALEAYPTEILQLAEGDLIVVFTDGIAELRDADGEFFEGAMGDVLGGCHGRTAAEVVAELVRAGEEFSVRPPGDDLAVLCIRLTGPLE